MADLNTDNINSEKDEISLREIIVKSQELWKHLLNKWVTILIAGIIGGALGLTYAFLKKPKYNAELNFALQDVKSGGGSISSALSMASQFGIDIGGGSSGGEFSSDNLLELMRSRSMIEKTLLMPVTIKGKQETLAELYINFNNLRDKWQYKNDLKNVRFLPGEDRSKFSIKQDSFLRVFYKKLIENNLSVEKTDKKSSIIRVSVTSTNELFSKYFAEKLTKVVSDFYIQTKIEKGAKNVAILQHQYDSVRYALNHAISSVASSIDATPNANPLIQTLKVPSQQRSVNITANTAVLTEYVKNLEISKMSLLQETPLIHIIDEPTLPLENDKVKVIMAIIMGVILAVFMVVSLITVSWIFKG